MPGVNSNGIMLEQSGLGRRRPKVVGLFAHGRLGVRNEIVRAEHDVRAQRDVFWHQFTCPNKHTVNVVSGVPKGCSEHVFTGGEPLVAEVVVSGVVLGLAPSQPTLACDRSP